MKNILTVVVLLFSSTSFAETIIEHEEGQLQARCHVDPLDPQKMYCEEYCQMKNGANPSEMLGPENAGWNCDKSNLRNNWKTSWNLNNPDKQVENCTAGPRSPTGYHDGECEVFGITTALNVGSVSSDFSCVEDCMPGNNQQAGGPFSGFVTAIESINSGNTVESDACEGFGAGCNYIHTRNTPWVTVTNGSIFDLASAGFSYTLNIAAPVATNNSEFTAYCSPGTATTVNLNNNDANFEMTYDANYPANTDVSGSCYWSVTLVEYQNGQPTGNSSSGTVRIEAEHVDI